MSIASKIRLRAAVPFIAGVLTGGLVVGGFWLGDHPGQAAPQAATSFPDVPADHWAAQAVSSLKSKNIVLGRSKLVYDGNQYVTRYEAAVLLDRFTHYIEAEHKPLTTSQLDSKLMPSIEPGWAHDSLVDLAQNKFVFPKSPLLTPPGTSPVTSTQMADALGEVSDRLVDRANGPQPDGSPPED